mmetsp:Transcript_23677/g.66487  ORF Transcript_23677/g.66487 Transcript_23677/m.66487 type:complete len:269 (-) Transcript_23677:2971-3777(-)
MHTVRLGVFGQFVLQANDRERAAVRERLVGGDRARRVGRDDRRAEAVAEPLRARPHRLVFSSILVHLGPHARRGFDGEVRVTFQFDALRVWGKQLLERSSKGGEGRRRQRVQRLDANGRIQLNLERRAADLLLEGVEALAPQRGLVVVPEVEGRELGQRRAALFFLHDVARGRRDARLRALIEVVGHQGQVQEPREVPRPLFRRNSTYRGNLLRGVLEALGHLRRALVLALGRNGRRVAAGVAQQRPRRELRAAHARQEARVGMPALH